MTSSPPSLQPADRSKDRLRRDEGAHERRTTAGPTLWRSITLPENGAPHTVVGLLHGFADYGGRYGHVASRWAEQGIGTVALDMRGHGRADGVRGACREFQDYLDDAAELAELVRERAPERPAFLYGHSFGGLVATSAVIASPGTWRGLLLTGPAFGIAVKVSPVKRLAGQLTSRFIPDFALPTGLCGTDLTHDVAIAAAYDRDPLVFKNARARWFKETLDAQARALAGAPSLRLPLYVTMGTVDRVSDFAAARAFFAAAGSADKTWESREGLFHEVLNEPEWPAIARRMAEWMIARGR